MLASGSQDWTISKLKAFRLKFYEIPEQALRRYNSLDPQHRLPLNPRTVANTINCFVIDEAKKAFEEISNSRFEDRNGTAYHYLNGCAIWYKQLGADGLPSNYPTDTAKEMMQGTLPWAPKPVLLVLGFEFDTLVTQLKRVEIQRYNSSGRMEYCIGLEKAVRAQVIKMPGSHRTATRTQVRIRRSPEQEVITVGEE